MNSALLETLRGLRANPGLAVELYPQLFQATFLVPVQRGSEGSIGSLLFLTYDAADVRELPVFTSREYLLSIIPSDAVLLELDGSLLWPRLLDVVETRRCEAAVDPGQPHGIRLNREMILGMVAEFGPRKV